MARDTIFDVAKTPEDLERMVLGVVKGIYSSLVIVGRGGTGKSTVVKQHFPANDEKDPPANPKEGAFWQKGRVSPVQFYKFLYTWRDRTIVLDDAPGLSKNLALAGLLRQLCETEKVRRVSWNTQNHTFRKMVKDPYTGEPEEVELFPSSFTTTSRFIMITNRWMDRHEEVEALETRVPIVKYDPSPELLHKLAKDHGYDKEVYAYVGAAIKDGRVHHINYRDYVNASNRKRNGDDWKRILELQFLPDTLDELTDDAAFVRSWALRHEKSRFTVADVHRGTTRWRGDRQSLDTVIVWMVTKGMLVKLPPRPYVFGRPVTQEYALPDMSQKSQKSQKRRVIPRMRVG